MGIFKTIRNFSKSEIRDVYKTIDSKHGRNIVRSGLRNGSTIRGIQRDLRKNNISLRAREISDFIKTNYAEGTISRWIEKFAEKTIPNDFFDLGRNTTKGQPVFVRGFVRAINTATNEMIFHTIDVAVMKNTKINNILRVIEKSAFERLSNSLNVEIVGTGLRG